MFAPLKNKILMYFAPAEKMADRSEKKKSRSLPSMFDGVQNGDNSTIIGGVHLVLCSSSATAAVLIVHHLTDLSERKKVKLVRYTKAFSELFGLNEVGS